jgi:translin
LKSYGYEGSMKGVGSELRDQVEKRERLLKDSRDVIAACSRSILAVHAGKATVAAREVGTAGKLLMPLREAAKGQLARYLVPPETEFVEASAVLALSRGRKVPARSGLGTSPEAYLLGLLDAVGELKRIVLDCMLKGRPKAAMKHFDEMEALYSTCAPMAAYDHVASGARRKIDVARMLVEDTRGLMTEAAGREAMAASIERLSRKLRPL